MSRPKKREPAGENLERAKSEMRLPAQSAPVSRRTLEGGPFRGGSPIDAFCHLLSAYPVPRFFDLTKR